MGSPDQVLAFVFTRGGQRWAAPVANLSPLSLFLVGAPPLPFREPLQLEVLDHSIRGEVALVSEQPRGVLVALDVPAEERRLLERLARRVPVLGPAATPEPGSIDLPRADAEPDHLPDLDALDPRNLPEGVVVGPGSADLDALSEVIDSIDLLGRPDEPHLEPAAPLDGLPTLDPDGRTVRFASLPAFRAHVEAHLAHGDLLVSGGALPIGARRPLALAVPGRAPHPIEARVIYAEPGRLSFMVDGFAGRKAAILALAE
jgi:hypothetical protein